MSSTLPAWSGRTSAKGWRRPVFERSSAPDRTTRTRGRDVSRDPASSRYLDSCAQAAFEPTDGGVCLDKPSSNRLRLLERRESRREIFRFLMHAADVDVALGQVTLELSGQWFRLGQLLTDGTRLLECRECLGRTAACSVNLADVVISSARGRSAPGCCRDRRRQAFASVREPARATRAPARHDRCGTGPWRCREGISTRPRWPTALSGIRPEQRLEEGHGRAYTMPRRP